MAFTEINRDVIAECRLVGRSRRVVLASYLVAITRLLSKTGIEIYT
jgi:hypothetical protein